MLSLSTEYFLFLRESLTRSLCHYPIRSSPDGHRASGQVAPEGDGLPHKQHGRFFYLGLTVTNSLLFSSAEANEVMLPSFNAQAMCHGRLFTDRISRSGFPEKGTVGTVVL